MVAVGNTFFEPTSEAKTGYKGTVQGGTHVVFVGLHSNCNLTSRMPQNATVTATVVGLATFPLVLPSTGGHLVGYSRLCPITMARLTAVVLAALAVALLVAQPLLAAELEGLDDEFDVPTAPQHTTPEQVAAEARQAAEAHSQQQIASEATTEETAPKPTRALGCVRVHTGTRLRPWDAGLGTWVCVWGRGARGSRCSCI